MAYRDSSKFQSATLPEPLLVASTESGGVHTPLVSTQPASFSGTPSNFTVGTTNATVFTLAAGERGFIQNLDTDALAVKLGASATTSSFSFILKAGVAADDGQGGAVWIDNHVGAVSVVAMTGTARYIAWKQAA